MWSIFDSLILVTGVIIAVIAILPIANIKAGTRVWSALGGGGLVVAALVLGNLRSFRYPSFVYIAPVLAVLVLGAVVADARKRGSTGAGLQFDEQDSGGGSPAADASVLAGDLALVEDQTPVGGSPGAVLSVSWVSSDVVESALPGARVDASTGGVERGADWVAANDPETSGFRLAEVVGRNPEFGAAVASHPNCYPELRKWIQDFATPASPL